MSYAEAEHLAFLVAEDEEEHFAPLLDGVSLLDLRNRQCRWPLGDMIEPATQFCGCDAPIGSSYCPAHRAMAYLGFPRDTKGISLRVIDGAGKPPSALLSTWMRRACA